MECMNSIAQIPNAMTKKVRCLLLCLPVCPAAIGSVLLQPPCFLVEPHRKGHNIRFLYVWYVWYVVKDLRPFAAFAGQRSIRTLFSLRRKLEVYKKKKHPKRPAPILFQ